MGRILLICLFFRLLLADCLAGHDSDFKPEFRAILAGPPIKHYTVEQDCGGYNATIQRKEIFAAASSASVRVGEYIY